MRTIPMTVFRLMTLPLTAALLLAIAGCSKSPDAESVKEPGAESAEADHAESGEADHAEGGEDHAEGEEGEAAEPVKMDEAALKAAGIQLQTLQPSTLSEELRAPGEVVDSAYGTTLITPRVEALVVRRHAKLGDEVRAGAPLVTLAEARANKHAIDWAAYTPPAPKFSTALLSRSASVGVSRRRRRWSIDRLISTRCNQVVKRTSPGVQPPRFHREKKTSWTTSSASHSSPRMFRQTACAIPRCRSIKVRRERSSPPRMAS